MNWIKENPFLTGLIAVTVIGAGALSFLLYQAAGQYSDTQDGYTQAVAKLHALQERVPYPNQENLDKSRAVFTEYKTGFDSLRQQLATIEAPLDPTIMPQQFQDNLRIAVNEVVKKAAAADTLLPKDFYLGFNIYSNSLPSEAAAPALSRQLLVIKQIIERLIELKVYSIDNLDRSPLPQEASAAPETPSESPGRHQGGGGGGRKHTEARGASISHYPISVSFTAVQSKLRVAFNSLLGADQFFIVRSVSLENTAQMGPPVAQASKDPNAAEPAPDPNALTVILGRERVRATLQLEMIDFPKPPAEAAK